MNNEPWLVAAAWLLGWVLLWRVPRLQRPARRQRDLPTCSVVIPARNEATVIESLVHDVLLQDGAPRDVVVVDDGSTDGTAEVARAAGARVLDVESPPPGWVGKNWACHLGSAATTGEVLIFLDADVRLDRLALAAVTEQVASRGGLVSVAPWHTVRRPYEWLSVLFGIVSMMGVGIGGLHRGRVRGAYGPCLALRRADYHLLGGHAAVRGDLVEDLALAERAVAHGLELAVCGGRDLVTYRMYPNGLPTLLEGWTKNIATGARRVPLVRTLAVAAWVAGLLSALIGALDSDRESLLVALLFALQVAVMARQTGDFPLRALLALPIAAGVFVAVFARSAYLVALRRPIAWRGRSIPVPPATARAQPEVL